MPVELARGILSNLGYQERNHHIISEATRLKLRSLRPFKSENEWYGFVSGLMRRDSSGGFRSLSCSSEFARMFRELLQRRALGFNEIWKETRPRLVDYRFDFEASWTPISDEVLGRLQDLAKTHWSAGEIIVEFIDCLNGGFGWEDSIGFATLPDMEVQKKFLAHELSELITSRNVVHEALRKAGFNTGITHTVVDMFAYFAVKDSMKKPIPPNKEKKGIRPNPSYYPVVDVLFPFFERYAENPSIYPDFPTLIEQMVEFLQKLSITDFPMLRPSEVAMQGELAR